MKRIVAFLLFLTAIPAFPLTAQEKQTGEYSENYKI